MEVGLVNPYRVTRGVKNNAQSTFFRTLLLNKTKKTVAFVTFLDMFFLHNVVFSGTPSERPRTNRPRQNGPDKWAPTKRIRQNGPGQNGLDKIAPSFRPPSF